MAAKWRRSNYEPGALWQQISEEDVVDAMTRRLRRLVNRTQRGDVVKLCEARTDINRQCNFFGKFERDGRAVCKVHHLQSNSNSYIGLDVKRGDPTAKLIAALLQVSSDIRAAANELGVVYNDG